MTAAAQVFDWLTRIAGAVGLPSVLLYLLVYRGRVKAAGRSAGAQAVVDEATIPVAIKSSSVTQLEAELAALAATFTRDRQLKGDTIDWLRQQLEEERAASRSKDEKIRDLEMKVTGLQAKVRELTEELQRVADELADLHGDPPRP